MKKNLLLISTALLLATLVLWPIRKVGDWYPMHDSTHPVRVLFMSAAWTGGQIPAIWADGVNNGFGYPLFHLYAPLFHTVATLFVYSPIIDITTALKIALFLFSFGGVLGTMLFAKRWGRIAAIVAGTAFAVAPYMAINIYVRGAFSEYVSIGLIPWVLLATEKIANKKQMVIAALSLSLFVLSHNLIPLLVLPMVAIWIAFNNRRSIRFAIGAIMLSITVSAWFVLPLFFERSFTKADEIARTTNYAAHFVEPWQMWNSTWGFGGSAEGVEDGMAFKLGKVQILLGMAGMVFAVLKKKKGLGLLVIFAVIMFFLATPYARVVWDASKTLQIVQFPWRSLGVLTGMLALFSGYAVSRIKWSIPRVGVAAGVIVALVILNYKYFAPQSVVTSVLDKAEIEQEQIPDIAPLIAEYQPIWWHPEKLQMSASEMTYLAPETTNIVEGTDRIQGMQKVASTYSYDLDVGETSNFSFPAAYYPTWEARIDDKKVEVMPDEYGLASIRIPSGRHTVTLVQSHTVLERVSYLVTLATIAGMVYLWRKNETG